MSKFRILLSSRPTESSHFLASMVTDLKSARNIIKLLKQEHPDLYGMNVDLATKRKIMFEINELDAVRHPETENGTLEVFYNIVTVDGVRLYAQRG